MGHKTPAAQVAKAVAEYVKAQEADSAFLKSLLKIRSRAVHVRQLATSLKKTLSNQLPEDFDLEGLIEAQLSRLARSSLYPKETKEARYRTLRRFLEGDIEQVLSQAIETGVERHICTRLDLEKISQEASVEIGQLLLNARQEILKGFDPKTRDTLAQAVAKLEARYHVGHVRELLIRRLGIAVLEEAQQALHQLAAQGRRQGESAPSVATKAVKVIQAIRLQAKEQISDPIVLQRIASSLDYLEKSFGDPEALKAQLQ